MPPEHAVTLDSAQVEVRLPVSDLEAARRWYAEHLGLQPVDQRPGHLVYRLAAGIFALFASTGSSNGTFTRMALHVRDIDAVVAALDARGVRFEEYASYEMTGHVADIPATPGGGQADRSAWFHDLDGNLISLHELQP